MTRDPPGAEQDVRAGIFRTKDGWARLRAIVILGRMLPRHLGCHPGVVVQDASTLLYVVHSASSITQMTAMARGWYAVMPPKPGFTAYGSPRFRTISNMVFRMSHDRYRWTKSYCR